MICSYTRSCVIFIVSFKCSQVAYFTQYFVLWLDGSHSMYHTHHSGSNADIYVRGAIFFVLAVRWDALIVTQAVFVTARVADRHTVRWSGVATSKMR